jgi:hypothetical protein
VAHRENPAMKEMEPSGGQATVDRIAAQAEADQLPPGDDTVLAARESRDFVVRVKFAAHTAA